jgi:Fur family transcriptional regulator, stress-responsive regulator
MGRAIDEQLRLFTVNVWRPGSWVTDDDSFPDNGEDRLVQPLPGDTDGAALEALRGAGLRVTKPRRAVLAWLTGNPHSTVDAIKTGVQRELGSVSTQAVYDVLNVCSAVGLLRRIELPGSPARFERRVGDNHHHLVCRECGRTEDVDCVVGARPCLNPVNEHGYQLEEAEVVFWGRCPECGALNSDDERQATGTAG